MKVDYFTGGIVIYGVGPGFNFVRKFVSEAEEVILPNGQWNFYAVGWDGNGTGVPMAGTAECAKASANLIGDNTSVTLSFSAANCSDPLNPEFGRPFTKNGNAPKYPVFYNCVNSDAVRFADKASCLKPNGADSAQIILKTQNGNLVSQCAGDTFGTISFYRGAGNTPLPFYMDIPGNFGYTVRLFNGNGCTGEFIDYDIKNFKDASGNKGRANTDFLNASYVDVYLHSPNPCRFAAHRDTAGSPATPVGIIDNGGATDHYAICNREQLDEFIEVNLSDNYKQYADIDFGNDNISQSIVTGSFLGSYDGQGHKISTIDFDGFAGGGTPVGIFQQINNAKIENLVLDDIDFDNAPAAAACNFMGALVSYITDGTGNGSVIKDITLQGTLSPNTFDFNACTFGTGIGGIIGGINDGGLGAGQTTIVERIRVDNVIFKLGDGHDNIGGVIGIVDNSNASDTIKMEKFFITDTDFEDGYMATTTHSENVGGAIGMLIGSGTLGETILRDVLASGIELGDNEIGKELEASYAGGIVGTITGNAEIKSVKATLDLYNTSVGGNKYAGGIAGRIEHNAEIKDAVAVVDFKDFEGSGVGGIVGQVMHDSGGRIAKLEHVRSFGEIQCLSICGGIVGQYRHTSGGSADSLITEKNYTEISITDSSLTGDIVGGFVGQTISSGATVPTITLNQFFFNGLIDMDGGTGNNVAGIVGVNGATSNVNFDLNDVVVAGTIQNANYLSGVAGINMNGAINCADGCILRLTIDDTGATGSGFVEGNNSGSGNFNGAANCTAHNSFTPGNANGFSSTCDTFYAQTALDLSSVTNVNSGFTIANFDDITVDSNSLIAPLYYIYFQEFGLQYLGKPFDPFPITTTTAWNSIGKKQALMDKAFRLDANLDFSSTTINSIGNAGCGNADSFVGTFYGNGYSISGATSGTDITATNTPYNTGRGLFNALCAEPSPGKGARINPRNDLFPSWSSRLIINDISVSGTSYQNLGILTGFIQDDSTTIGIDNRIEVRNVRINGGSVSSNAARIGSISGNYIRANTDSIFENLYSSADLVNSAASFQMTGGIIGNIGGTANSSQATVLKNLIFTGTIDASSATDGRWIGGITGSISNTEVILFRPSVINATITGSQEIGGIVGRQQGASVVEAYTSGTINVPGSQIGLAIGGITGQLEGTAPVAAKVLSSMSTMTLNNLGATDNKTGGIIGDCASCDGNDEIKHNFSFAQSITTTGADVHPILSEIESSGVGAEVYAGNVFVTPNDLTTYTDINGSYDLVKFVGTPSVYEPSDTSSLNGPFNVYILEKGFAPIQGWREYSLEPTP